MPGSDADHTPTVGHTIARWRCAVEPHVRADRREVGVRLGVDLGEALVAALDSTSVRNAVDAASPASFHPVKAATHHRVAEGRFSQPTDVLHVGVNPTGAPSAVS